MSKVNSIVKNNYDMPKYITCKECEYTLTCPRFDNCSFLLNQNYISDKETISKIEKLKAATIPLPFKKFGIGAKDKNTSADKKTPIYIYHRSLVNDALNIIRKGGTAYVYTEQVLKDILRLERDVQIHKQDGIYYIKSA